MLQRKGLLRESTIYVGWEIIFIEPAKNMQQPGNEEYRFAVIS